MTLSHCKAEGSRPAGDIRENSMLTDSPGRPVTRDNFSDCAEAGVSHAAEETSAIPQKKSHRRFRGGVSEMQNFVGRESMPNFTSC